MSSQTGASGWSMISIWLAFGLAGGLIGGLEVYLVSDGDVHWTLAIVGLGLVLGLLIGIIFTVFFSGRPITRAPLSASKLRLLLAFTTLVVSAHIAWISGGPLIYVLLMALSLIPFVALLRLGRRSKD